MTISAIIQKLEQIKTEYGDLPAMWLGGAWEYWGNEVTFEVKEALPGDRKRQVRAEGQKKYLVITE